MALLTDCLRWVTAWPVRSIRAFPHHLQLYCVPVNRENYAMRNDRIIERLDLSTGLLKSLRVSQTAGR
jgi:hypothetical protein